MQSLGENVYAYNLPDGWTSAKVIFNDGSKNQYPAPQQPGLDWTDGTSMAYIDGVWPGRSCDRHHGGVTMIYYAVVIAGAYQLARWLFALVDIVEGVRKNV